MAKKSFPLTTGDNVAEIDALNRDGAPMPPEPDEQPAASAPATPKPRSDAAPLKPGARKITLAQARAHHARA